MMAAPRRWQTSPGPRQLAQLAAGDREALLLHARDGLSSDEVALQLGVSIGA